MAETMDIDFAKWLLRLLVNGADAGSLDLAHAHEAYEAGVPAESYLP